MKKVIMFFIAGMFLLSACAPKEGIEVSNVWARTSTQGMNSAVYLVIQNHNAEADELTGAASNIADAVEVHESKMENGVMMMNHVDSVTLEPSGKVEFMPGGYHIMLIGLKQDLNTGDEFELTLQFKNSPDMVLKVMVKEPDGANMNGMSH